MGDDAKRTGSEVRSPQKLARAGKNHEIEKKYYRLIIERSQSIKATEIMSRIFPAVTDVIAFFIN